MSETKSRPNWAKNTFAWGFGRYKFQHEPIFYCHVAGESDAWYGDKSQSTLWPEKKPAANRLHPTMKLLSVAGVFGSQIDPRRIPVTAENRGTGLLCSCTFR